MRKLPATLALAGALLVPSVAGSGADAWAQAGGQGGNQGASARQQAISDALTALGKAPDEQFAGALESRIRAQWLEQASPAIKLLLARAQRNLMAGAGGEALADFDAALDLDPNLVEGWRGRAQARAQSGDAQGAVRDLQEVLRREPRHFAALQDLSRMAEQRGDWRGALAAWQKVLEVSPHTPNGQPRLQDLRRRALGEAL